MDEEDIQEDDDDYGLLYNLAEANAHSEEFNYSNNYVIEMFKGMFCGEIKKPESSNDELIEEMKDLLSTWEYYETCTKDNIETLKSALELLQRD